MRRNSTTSLVISGIFVVFHACSIAGYAEAQESRTSGPDHKKLEELAKGVGDIFALRKQLLPKTKETCVVVDKLDTRVQIGEHTLGDVFHVCENGILVGRSNGCAYFVPKEGFFKGSNPLPIPNENETNCARVNKIEGAPELRGPMS